MSIPVATVLLPAPNTVFLTSGGLVLGFSVGDPIGSYRFLKDHYVDEEFIPAGEVREMFTPWVPTSDVEPMDNAAVSVFYQVGPQLSGCIRTHFDMIGIPAPVTYWDSTATPGIFRLTGLGASRPPMPDPSLIRIKDKE